MWMQENMIDSLSLRILIEKQVMTSAQSVLLYNELIIRGYQIDVGNIELREKRNNEQYVKKQAEVDFVLNQGSKRYYIQSAYEMPSPAKKEQEEKSLINIPDSFKKIIIVGGDIIPKHDENGITIIGLKDFLLNPNCLEL